MTGARRRIAVAVSVLALAAGGGLWLSRVPIATHVVDRELGRRGVPARYHIADLGLGRQRLTDVVIGDPAHPDLVADWIETQTDIGLSGARLIAVRAGHVRMSARLRDGRLSLGAIDRLLPPPSGGPFALPSLDLSVEEARVALATPYGPVALRLRGQGRLDDGFRGRVAARAPLLALPDCRLDGMAADVAIRITATAPRVSGPLAARALTCGGARVQALASDVDIGLSPELDRWFGSARVAARQAAAGGARLDLLRGTIGFRGDAQRTTGRADLTLARATTAIARSGAARWLGRWRLDGARATLAGRISAEHVALDRAWRARLASAGDGAAGTPVAPLVAGAARDAARAAGDMLVSADLALATGTPSLVTIERAAVDAATGARLRLDSGAVTIGHPAGLQIAGDVDVAGGGLPRAQLRLSQSAPGGAIGGTAVVAPYARDGAMLALTPLRFGPAGGSTTRVSTIATLSGPLGSGRVEGLRVPLDARWDGRGRLAIDPGCTPVAFRRLAVSSIALGPTEARLCPTGRALVELADGRVAGGARWGALNLAGAIGTTPLRLDSAGGMVMLADRRFALDDVTALIGGRGRTTRISAAQLTGTPTAGGVAGAFTGGGGQVANVPLVMSAGAGTWRYDRDGLAVDGALQVADAQVDAPRFRPLAARGVALTLKGDEIRARGDLFEPATATRIAAVTIAHRLSHGAGEAKLAVPGITFDKGLQPDQLTPVTFGVIADVHGTVTGDADIRWDMKGVTSTGTFMTSGMNLAAAFGPVTGLAGTIHFTDLLALESAPAQVATVASINPGIAVTDGRIVYQLLSGLRVKVDAGNWPFAGGTLSLDPTLLDFAASRVRHLTFRVEGMEAGRFLQQFDFGNINATGTFDGVLPMTFDDSGGRIAGGRLTARPGGGSIAYLGELTEKDLGFWANLAFRSLRSLTYRSLDVQMDGPLAGEMVTGVRFTGIKQGKGAQSNFLLRRLTRLPIQFNITIRAPFRGLIDSAASFYDPQRLVKRNLQALIDEQNRKTGVQPPASENVP